MSRIRIIVAVTAAALVLSVPALRAYVTYGQWGTLSVNFYVNPTNLDVSESAATSALQAGMNVWNTQSGTGFRFGYAGRVSDTTTGFDNRNVMLFRNQSNGSTIASTYSWSSNGLLVDSDIVFWDGGSHFFTGTAGCSTGAYIEDIATHELGHAMGLQHSSVAEATMNPLYTGCSQTFRTLAADDIAGAQALYANGPGVADAPPTVTILTPANGANATSSAAVTFSGSAIDAKDGNISSKLVWKSNIDGQIGTGASFSKALTAGNHTVSATVTDSIGFTITQAIVVYVTSGSTNTAPTVTISSPADGASFASGAAITFTGSATDQQDSNLTAALVWRSSIDGQIGTGGTFTRTLTSGTHTISATATDSGGLVTQRAIGIIVAAPVTNTAPSVVISSPSNGASYSSGATITFSGSASDTQDGNLTSSMVWRSSIDGQIGTGGTFTRTLTSGTHTITATVSDSGALTKQTSISVTVAASSPPQPPTSPTLVATGRKVEGLKFVDLTWANLTTTSVDVYRNGVKVVTVTNSGMATDRLGDKSGTYTYKVCGAGTTTCTNQASVTF